MVSDKAIIRLAELGAGCFVLWLHAQYGIDNLLILIAGILLGMPIDKMLGRFRSGQSSNSNSNS